MSDKSEMNDKPSLNVKSNTASLVIGAILILMGVLFLVGRVVGSLFHFDFGHFTWPLYIILPGLLLFLTSFAVERHSGVALAIVGGVVTATGLVLLVQNTFDIYASWAYAWALVAPTSIGLSKLVYGSLRRMPEQIKGGLNLAGIGLAIFIAGGIFFELVIGLNGIQFAGAWLCWPVLLIGLGVVLLASSLLRSRRNTSVN